MLSFWWETEATSGEANDLLHRRRRAGGSRAGPPLARKGVPVTLLEAHRDF